MTTTVRQAIPGKLVDQSGHRQQLHDEAVPQEVRRETGHFGTTPSLAAFMANMVTIPTGKISILDPGAGVGTLTAAVCDRIAQVRTPRKVYLELWENDPILECHLMETVNDIVQLLEDRGHEVETAIHIDDFIIANSNDLLTVQSKFDITIMNPPYFKLRKESLHARAMPHVVHGQPNIYALFMAKATELLNDTGQLVAITPRSYFNGPYFKLFRKWFLKRMTPVQIHVFESRKDAFSNDDVLQENVILSAKKNLEQGKNKIKNAGNSSDSRVLQSQFVNVTSSHGRDTSQNATDRKLNLKQVVSGPDQIIRITTNNFDQKLIDSIERLPQRFSNLGLDISTGPVVTFRATEFLLHNKDDNSAPLLMMHNVRPFETVLSTKNGKPSHVRVCQNSLRILIPSERYVLLKRFTSKEQKRRLVAGIVEPEHSYSDWIGLENHLNYVHKNGKGLSKDEAFGIAALFNSLALDTYLRAISGNTQVNAAEIRALCLPTLPVIKKLGKAVRSMLLPEAHHIEELVAKCLGLSSTITKKLMESA